MITKIKIGTRESKLAIWQANYAKTKLESLGLNCELIKIKSEGDVNQITPLYDFGVSGIFTKSLDQSLLNNTTDIAVHSFKDVPINLAKGLSVHCVFERASSKDILVFKEKNIDFNKDLTIATSSIRRKTQWKNKYPNHKIVSLRGNVGSRITKLEKNDWDGAIFAKAGLDRLSIYPENKIILDWMIPSAAQGAIAIASRTNENELNNLLKSISCSSTFHCVSQERQFLKLMNGGCSVPISAFAKIEGDKLVFKASISSMDSKNIIKVEDSFDCNDLNTGEKMYKKILKNGGKKLLQEIKKVNEKN
ncbi:MAG: hydroxymethylbilane synthase [Flavobacteriaceae bacterium]|nr:hydroxymethylbilane synthase [Flavobacteriaceae bacterium]MDG1791706.1 hydroxymethylbilane synthase [Flavobacteriaceae bacterium]